MTNTVSFMRDFLIALGAAASLFLAFASAHGADGAAGGAKTPSAPPEGAVMSTCYFEKTTVMMYRVDCLQFGGSPLSPAERLAAEEDQKRAQEEAWKRNHPVLP